MKIGISTRPEYSLGLTRPQIDVLIECSQNHYDHTCQQASNAIKWSTDARTLENSFLSLWARMYDNNLPYQYATHRQMDLCCKILEISGMLWCLHNASVVDHVAGNDEKRDTAISLRQTFMRAMMEANSMIQSKAVDL